MTMQDTTSASGEKNKPALIGFPAPLLGAENLRLCVLHLGGGILALDKPANVLAGAHPWYKNEPVLAEALNVQLKAEKPELLRLGLDPKLPLEPVFHIDPGIAGVCPLAIGPEAAAKVRNAYGSTQWELTFMLLGAGDPDGNEVVCDMPVARHRALPQALVSTTTGKKTETRFRRIERIGRHSLWEATTIYYRADQLPVHAAEVGIRIVGEGRYCREATLYMSRVKRGWDGDIENERPLYDAPFAWLASVKMEDGTKIEAPCPSRLDNAIRQLRKYARK